VGEGGDAAFSWQKEKGGRKKQLQSPLSLNANTSGAREKRKGWRGGVVSNPRK